MERCTIFKEKLEKQEVLERPCAPPELMHEVVGPVLVYFLDSIRTPPLSPFWLAIVFAEC